MAVDRQRAESEGWVLHAYPYKESSLLLDAFTRHSGRIALLARGAKRPRSELRGRLMAFQPLTLSWQGKSEIKTLLKVEWLGGMALLTGESLLCGFYLNELLMRLLVRDDAHEELFEEYSTALRRLNQGENPQVSLRRFEKSMLKELGYELRLDREANDGPPIQANKHYGYDPEKGPIAAEALPGASRVSGSTLLCMACDEYDDPRTLAESKQLIRQLIDHRLESRPLHSRRVFKELMEL